MLNRWNFLKTGFYEGIKLEDIESELIQVKSGDFDRMSQPQRLNAKLAELTSVVASADSAPTRQSYEVFEDLSARTEAQLQRLKEAIDTDLAEFANMLHELEVPAIQPDAPP